MSKDFGRGAFHHPGVNPFTTLDQDWNTVAARAVARRAIRAWAEHAPGLAGYDSPADLVADIGRMGDPERSCHLLAQLLVLAKQDTLAGRAVLQAVTPGLRRAAARRCRTASGNGPWPTYEDIAADTISAAWEAIRAHAGQRHDYPARIIVGFAEGRLRRAHESWLATNRDLTELTDDTRPRQPVEADLGTEEQALTLITDALEAGVIHSKEASILIATAVHGQSVTDAERSLDWAPKSGYRVLERARRALRKWTDDRGNPASPHVEQGRAKTNTCLTVELPSHSMTPPVSPELCALLATLIRRRADLARPGAAA